MKRSSKLILIIISIVFFIFLISPTIKWYFLIDNQDKALSAYSREYIRDYAKDKTFKDLTKLKGIYKNSPQEILPTELKYLEPIAKINYERKGKKAPSKWTVKDIREGFLSDEDIKTLSYETFKYYDEIKSLKSKIINLGLDLLGGMSITISLDYSAIEEKMGKSLDRRERADALERTISILKERVDKFGLTEPKITVESSGKRIFLDIPGERDESKVNNLIEGSGLLKFHIVEREKTELLNSYIHSKGALFNLEQISREINLKDEEKIVRWFSKDSYGLDDYDNVRYYVVLKDAKNTFDGSYIMDARVDKDKMTGRDLVFFKLTSEGGEKFFEFTSNHVGKALAVVIEDKVKSIAGIEKPIPGGNVSIQGDSFTQEEAVDLALSLRMVAFPVDLTVSDLRVVGPSLGKKTIELGIYASLLSLVLIFTFIILYYRLMGFITALSLIFNLMLILALLSAFSMTLTLTNIAGLILTIGMAVDINIVIYERIKEELREGKTFLSAFENGFNRAFLTIMDANITTFISVVFLTLLGTGIIQGFAWTLSIGIVSSLFSSLIFSKCICEYILAFNKSKKISIGWGLKYAKN